MKPKMVSDVKSDGVFYGVVNESGELIWHKFVAFGQTDVNCAGGYAFREAAREQERIAFEYVGD